MANTRMPFLVWCCRMPKASFYVRPVMIGIFSFFTVFLLYTVALKTSCKGSWPFLTNPKFQYVGYYVVNKTMYNLPVSAKHYLNMLPSNDKTNLLNVSDFAFVINQEKVCEDKKPVIVTLIASAAGNYEKRKVIRETWAKKHENLIFLFVLGLSDEHEYNVTVENEIYGDIIQGNFIDTYRNLTFKHVMTLKWVTYHCPDAIYILKVDDDVFVHITSLLEFTRLTLSPKGAQRLIMCDPQYHNKVQREKSKWAVSIDEYSYQYYPIYCNGYAILYSPDVVFHLYVEAQMSSTFFWIDDVHITGTLAGKIKVPIVSFKPLILKNKFLEHLISNPASYKDFLFGPPNLNATHIIALHQIISNRTV